jgi:hypothetical protein
MADMSADVLKNNLTNPAKTYLWEMLFTNPIGGGDSDVMDLRCQTTVIPGRGHGQITVPFKGTPGIVFPGKLTMSHTWTMTFIEGTDRKVFDALHGWQEAITGARTGVGGPDVAIKADVYLRCLSMQGEVWMTIKAIGMFVQNVDDVPLNYEDDTSIYFNATFSFDRWELVS